MENRLYLPGHDSEIASAYFAADIVICPSTDPEAFGRTAAEAQAMGRPVVASDHGGAVEVVEHGKAGWRVPPDDAPALANAIERIDGLTDMAGARDTNCSAILKNHPPISPFERLFRHHQSLGKEGVSLVCAA